MWNEPTREDLAKLPQCYDTEEVPSKEKVVHMHFFLAGCDWYACEWDGEDRFFGYVILNNDFEMSEWGYFSLTELKRIRISGAFEVDRDLHWRVRKARHVDKICKGMSWAPSGDSITRMLDTCGIISDTCKSCGALVETDPSEKNLFCKSCGTTSVKETYYIGKKMQAQKPTA